MKEQIAMYIDPEIVLENIPPKFVSYLEELQQYYDEDNYYAFMDLLEVVEAMTKNLYSEGRITHEQLNAIFQKYGIA